MKVILPFIVLLIVLGVIFGPLLMIWALNTLSSLGITYTFWTWAASLILCGVFAASSSHK